MCSEFEQAVKSNTKVKEALRNVFAAFLEADPSEVVVCGSSLLSENRNKSME